MAYETCGETGRIRAGRSRAAVCLLALAAVSTAPFCGRAAAEAGTAVEPLAGLDPALLNETVERAAALERLNALLVAHHGRTVVARVFRGPGLDEPVNVKSVSKAVIGALAGAAIERGVLEGADQRIAPLLDGELPTNADPRVRDITIDHLLAMRAGLERTSGPYYGRWVSSRNWARFALSRPFVDEPGGRMLYSTGNTHLVSAILTRASGRSTLALARDWLGEPLGIEVPPWQRDPQGIYLGGNNMSLSPRALLRFGEMFRNGGVHEGRRVLPESWVRASWTPRSRSPYTGHYYGYGWSIAEARGQPVYYAWGYGGQLLYVIPALALTIVMTSDPTVPSRSGGYRWDLHGLVADGFIPAAGSGADAETGAPDAPLARRPAGDGHAPTP